MINKTLIVVMDGLGDRPIPGFDGKTPLQKAQTPFLDHLADNGINAMVDPLYPGIPVSTHTGMALLMGVPPKEAVNLARGPVEAAGIDLKTNSGDIILRCNFAHIESEQDVLKVLDRRAGRINQGTGSLAKALNSIQLPYGIESSFHPTTQHRCVLHLRGDKLSEKISDTDCLKEKPALVKQCQPLDNTLEARQTAEAINIYTEQAHKILASHPLNGERILSGQIPASGILCRSAGQIKAVNNLLNYYKLKVAVVSAEATVIGLAKMFGFKVYTDPGFTALADTDIQLKVATAQKALVDHDLVYLHIKGTDICSHDFQPELKAQFIEKIDQALAKLPIEQLNIAVTADHSTDSNTGFHCSDPVPSLLHSANVRHDRVQKYSEQDCMSGGLGRINANSFLLTILDHLGCLHNYKTGDLKFFQ